MKSSLLKNLVLGSTLALFVLGLTGCSKRFDDMPVFSALPLPDPFNNSVGRFKTSYLADQIHAYFRGNTSAPIAVATFVDLDNLYTSSSFGRFLSEQLMSELAMKGYNVIELRHSEALQVMFDQGEFGLSRDLQLIKNSQQAAAIVVGTYVVSPVRVYLNARVIDPKSSIIRSAGSVEMAKSDEIDRMLRTSNFLPTMERIPVRAMASSSSPLPYYWQQPSKRGQMFEDESIYPAPGHGGSKSNDIPKPPMPKL